MAQQKLQPYHTNKPGAKKFVTFKDGSAIVFPKTKVHKFEAARHGGTPVSAGFMTKNDNKVQIFGHSDSLQMKPKAGDTAKLKKALKITK